MSRIERKETEKVSGRCIRDCTKVPRMTTADEERRRKCPGTRTHRRLSFMYYLVCLHSRRKNGDGHATVASARKRKTEESVLDLEFLLARSTRVSVRARPAPYTLPFSPYSSSYKNLKTSRRSGVRCGMEEITKRPFLACTPAYPKGIAARENFEQKRGPMRL